MGRIKKVATERHTATASPFISNFVQQATSIPLAELPSKLNGFPQSWPFPRGDLYHWIPLLDRFDHVLELFNKEYGLDQTPQQQPFEMRLLLRGDAEEGMPYPAAGTEQQELERMAYSAEGDRELVESVVHFTRILLEHCGNRSLYASSGHLNDLLNTTSLSLLQRCLRLSLRLAQRYQVARYKNNHPHAQAVLLHNHYNFNFDRLNKIAQPFPKPPAASVGSGVTPSKGKEKVSTNSSYNPSDLVAIAKESESIRAKADVSSVHLTYYDQPTSSSRPGTAPQSSEAAPISPTPVRRTSALGPSRDRPSIGERSSTTGDVNSTPVKTREAETPSSSAAKTYSVSFSKVTQTSEWELVREAMPELPADTHYDLLNRIRVAKAFATPDTPLLPLALEVRLLAIANLACALGETKFQEKIGLADSEEPKRFHLAQQLCDLLQPASNGQSSLSLQTQTVVLLTVEALSKSRNKSSEVSDALQISANHGILYYELRKVIASLSDEECEDKKLELEDNEWREATFDLINTLLQSNTQARHGERMVSAGIMGILVEALNLRTARAERFYEKILLFFDSFIHGITSAFQTLANVRGLDIMAELMSYEVTTSLQNAKDGKGLPAEFKSKVVDYEIPFYQQSTVRQLFKFTVHLFEHNAGAGTNDRLLRNLIDTPQVLGALRNVIENATVFGSNVWSGAVNIISSFIHEEPTSFQVVGEAGLVKSLLQTIVPWDLKDAEDDGTKLEDIPSSLEYKDGELQLPTPSGILPVGEIMCDLPTAFGAICLNESGMKLFQSSKALLKFMDVFVSPPHVRALEEEAQTAATMGQAFDELARHHPQLKDQILFTVITMVKRVGEVCRYLAEHDGVGAKLWENTPFGIVVSGGREGIAGHQSTEGTSHQSVGVDDIQEADKDRVTGVPYLSACFKFLDGFFHNSGMCSAFCEQGGAIFLLDLATSASNPYDIVAFPIFSKIAQVLRTMCEAKPHLVLPSLIRHTQIAIADLKPLIDNKSAQGAFAAFIDLSDPQTPSMPDGHNGTTVLKSLGVMMMLTNVLGRALSPPPYTHSRHSHASNQTLTICNFTDIYIELVDSLSKLHAAFLWENLALQEALSNEWKQQTEPKPYMVRRVDANGVVELAGEIRTDSLSNGEATNGTNGSEKADKREDTFAKKNVKAIRYLLSQSPAGIESFFHALSQALVPKRSVDSTTKQQFAMVADSLAEALLWEIEYKKFDSANEAMQSKYTVQAVAACTRAMLKNSTSMEHWNAKEALTLVLNKFYLLGGFQLLNSCLLHFGDVLADKNSKDLDLCARDGLSAILGFYSHVLRSKCISESTQTNSITNRHHEQPDFFTSGHFLVEIRDAVLPSISKLWNSDALECVGDNHAKSIIEILRTILKGEGEDKALKRSDNASRRVQASKPEFRLRSTDGLRGLKSSGFEEGLAREALYRCCNNEANAHAYCHLRKICEEAPSFPIPTGEPSAPSEQQPADSSTTAQRSESQPLQRQRSVEMIDAADVDGTAPPLPDEDISDAAAPASEDLISDDVGLGELPADLRESDLMAMVGNGRLRHLLGIENGESAGHSGPASVAAKDTHQPFTTVEDLDDKRRELRDNLIDRCLEVLSAQNNITFELADLIQAAVAKNGDGSNTRADIGSTLVSSLLSLQGEESSEQSGAKISAYAHLVALVLQDRQFFTATLDELKNYFDALVAWIQLGQDQKVEDAPWIEMVLLIIERVLAEDEQPAEIAWTAPSPDDPLKTLPEPVLPEPVVPAELRSTLLDALVDLLPKIGKNASLALSVSRVLVIVTRRREFATRLSEKSNMSRLFMMIRQLAGSVNDKLQSSFTIILRHMVEDEQILRQIMQTEIKASFENHRTSRAMDTTTYTRNMYHLVLRDPELFVSVTQEMLEIPRYDGNANRPQALALKQDKAVATVLPNVPLDAKESNHVQSEAQKSVEEGSADGTKSTEIKPPTVEASDGVVQFLLRELSNYKDVEEKPVSSAKPADSSRGNLSPDDVDMTDAPSTTFSVANAGDSSSVDANGKTSRPLFKPEDHMIYIYRCFIMQCLVELLASYNRTKVEFINFSRKPETQPATPSKPRSGTLNYLLNVLIPIGTLEHRDDIAHRKRLSTSHWATVVLVSLVSRTAERQTPRAVQLRNPNEEDADLAFVRKFVLEHALRSFKDATASSEPLDQRYSRMLALGELFNRVLLNKGDRITAMIDSANRASRHLGKLMYEKNFIGALTSAIAELDLNFPNAKRAVKYILQPLKLLTDLGVWLSQTLDLASNAGGTTTDEEDISSATSVSDDDDEEREQTPDLYRNSTLGMFESSAAREDEEDSEDEDEEEDDEDEMYDDGYEDEMEFEEQVPDHGEVISDDEDDDMIAGADEMGDIEGRPGDMAVDIDVVMANEDEDATSSGSEDDDDDIDIEDEEDDDEDGHDFDELEEIAGDEENASMHDHDLGDEWEEDDGAGFETHDVHDGGSPHGGPLGDATDPMEGEMGSDPEDQNGVVQIDMGGDDEYFEDEMPPEGEDDEDDGADYAEDVVYEPELDGLLDAIHMLDNLLTFNDDAEGDDDDQDEPGMRWDFDAPAPPVIARGGGHHHHHHHRHGLNDMFGVLGSADRNLFRSGFRTHRPTSNARGEEDGLNPLLLREGGAGTDSRERDLGPFAARFGRRTPLPRQGEAFIQDLVATIGPNGNHAINVNVEPQLGGGLGGQLPPVFAIRGGGGHALIDIDPSRPLRDQIGFPRFPEMIASHRSQDSRSPASSEEAQAVQFTATPTVMRWQEEAKMLFSGKHLDKVARIVNALLRVLVPEAMEAKRLQDKAEADRKAAEEKVKEEERKKAEAEKAEREARERQEREEREAQEAEEARARDSVTQEAGEGETSTTTQDVATMEGVEQSEPPPTTEAAPEAPQGDQAPAQRITTTIRGREIDITNLGIDLEYLNALPEEMREEVVMTQFAEQRSQAVQAGEQPSEISREFLDALPPEIQRELIRQEAHDRRRREQDEARRRAAQEGQGPAAAQPEEMNNADFMAMLDPQLRQQILAEADENTLAAFPEEIQAEARTLGERRLPRAGVLGGIGRFGDGPARILHRHQDRDERIRTTTRKTRPVVQMLDKSGIATLLRLMFVSLHHKAKTNLHHVLSDVSKNTQNRAEVISILLTILQDGTADVSAVERSFAALSLRAKQLSGPKTPQTLKRTATGTGITSGAELSPLNIVQQCLGTLNALTTDNSRVPSFFLSEHEMVANQKAKSSKKGKEQETKAAKYPLNALLSLLDRKLITENTGVMEALASLLNRVTHPLISLPRKVDAASEADRVAQDMVAESAPPQSAGSDVQMGEATASDNEANAVTDPTAANTADDSAGAEGPAASNTGAEGAGSAAPKIDDKKKQRELVPPEVPDENIRLVVNIITARECPAKTFSETLDVIKNLSAIPGAKEIFGKEIVRQAQDLSHAVLVDLVELAKQIDAAQTGTDLQGVALANFSSAASKQQKLLRCLIALDHLFDPTRMPPISPPSSDPEKPEPKLKDDILAMLHESSTFDKLWSQLSQCLAAIREKGNMINVAAILLPLIESLMVVCRTSSLKDTSAIDPISPLSVSTPPPEARLESLFFRFTEEHRKILNELIRNSPKLMNGNLAVLAKNSKVLEFDNKRSYFTRKLHTRIAGGRQSHPSLQLSVRREQVFLDSFKSLYYKSGDEIKYGKLNIRFHGEEGIDAGGVSREWFAAMARQMFNPDFALFNPVASDRTTFHPNPVSEVNPEHLMFFKFIGRIIGKALYEGRVLDCHFSRAVYRKILGKSVSLKDMETLDLDYYKSLVWILENNITDITFDTFSVDIDRFGAVETVDLVPDGRNIVISEENKHEYVRLVVEHRLIKSVELQLTEFLSGFHEIIPPELVSIFNEQELELLISGLPEIDVDDWKNNTEYHNYQATSPQIQWFWRAVRSFDKEEKAKLLQFVTGTSKVPLNGFKELEGMNGFAKFNIHRDYSNKEKLPSSHTCFNQLDLPEYESYEHLRQQLYTAITAGSEYFGFA